MTCILVINANKHGNHRYDDGVPGNEIKDEDKAHQFEPASVHISIPDGLLSLVNMEETTPLQQLDLGSCYTLACQYGYCGDEGLRFIHGFLPSNFGQEVPKCPRPNIGPRANSVVRSTA